MKSKFVQNASDCQAQYSQEKKKKNAKNMQVVVQGGIIIQAFLYNFSLGLSFIYIYKKKIKIDGPVFKAMWQKF